MILKSELIVNDLKQLLVTTKKEVEKLQKEVVSLENILDSNEGYRLKKQLENDLENKHSQLDQLTIKYNDYVNKLTQETTILKQLRIKESFINNITSNNYDSESCLVVVSWRPALF